MPGRRRPDERRRRLRTVDETSAGGLVVVHLRHRAALIGRLDDLVTHSGFLVAPFAGVIHEPGEYVMQETEVVEVFEVPIEVLLDIRNPEVRYVPFRRREFPAYFYRYGDYEIWGLTGRMLKAFLDLVWQAI